MIIRIWKGTTTHENSKKYEQLLKEVVFPRIEQKKSSRLPWDTINEKCKRAYR